MPISASVRTVPFDNSAVPVRASFTVTRPADGTFDNDTISYTWDAVGRRTGTTLSDDPNVGGALRAAISYTYDSLGRMATVTSPTPDSGLGTPDSWTYSYLAASNQVASLTMPGEVTTTRTYDSLGRLGPITVSGLGSARQIMAGRLRECRILPDRVTAVGR